MKKIIITTVLTLLTLLSIGQIKSKKVDIEWGPKLKESRKSTLGSIVGVDETGMYLTKYKRKSFTLNYTIILEHYNKNLEKTKSEKIEIINHEKELDAEFIVHLNNKLYVFSSFKNRKLKRNFLFVQTINKKTLLPNNDLVKIAEIDYKKHSKYNAGGYHLRISCDSSKVLVYYDLPYKKNEKEKFGFHVFDNNMNQIWEKKVKLPYTDKLFEIQNYKVNNGGNVYLLGIKYKDKRKGKRKGKPNYKYHILSYTNNGNDSKEYPISVKDYFLTDMQIAINDEQDIVCGGFYSEKGTFSIKGSYFLKIDGETTEIVTRNFNEFGIDFITQNMSKRKKKKAKKKAKKGKNVELYQYDLDDIILKSDGGAMLIGEQFYIRTVTTYNQKGGSTTRYYYYYNDIIVINMSSEGVIEWTEKIPKRQTTSNDQGFWSSYAVTVIKDKLYFVFNDNPKNLFYKDGGKLYNFKKSSKALTVLVEVDSSGKQTKEALFTSKEAGILVRPKVCQQISDNEMIIFGQRGKSQRFAKATFK